MTTRSTKPRTAKGTKTKRMKPAKPRRPGFWSRLGLFLLGELIRRADRRTNRGAGGSSGRTTAKPTRPSGRTGGAGARGGFDRDHPDQLAAIPSREQEEIARARRGGLTSSGDGADFDPATSEDPLVSHGQSQSDAGDGLDDGFGEDFGDDVGGSGDPSSASAGAV